jgi:hypothetical protein
LVSCPLELSLSVFTGQRHKPLQLRSDKQLANFVRRLGRFIEHHLLQDFEQALALQGFFDLTFKKCEMLFARV